VQLITEGNPIASNNPAPESAVIVTVQIKLCVPRSTEFPNLSDMAKEAPAAPIFAPVNVVADVAPVLAVVPSVVM
jgi:hypothetical protein